MTPGPLIIAKPPTPYYQSERVTLYCGDCLEVLPMLSGVDAVVTDPPYGVGLKAKQHKWFDRKGTGYESTDDTIENVVDSVLPAIEACRSIASAVVLTPGPKCLWMYPNPDGWGVVFNKAGSGIGPWGFQCAQPILYYGKCPYTSRCLGNRPSSYEQSPIDFAGENGHPCPKPLGMTEWLVRRASLENHTILDPFMGSGTTGVAAVRLGRKFIGIEIDEGYCAIAKRRIIEAENAFALFDPPKPEQQAEMFAGVEK